MFQLDEESMAVLRCLWEYIPAGKFPIGAGVKRLGRSWQLSKQDWLPGSKGLVVGVAHAYYPFICKLYPPFI